MKKVFLLSFLFVFLSAGNSFAVKQQVCEGGACADIDFYRDGNKLKGTITGISREFSFYHGAISIVQNTNIIGVDYSFPDENEALIECAGLGSMCWGDINPGVTAYFTISDFPVWFNINQAFIAYYNNTAFNFDSVTPSTTTTTSIIPTTSVSPTTTTSSTIDASVKAVFYGSPTAGDAPLTVKFTNLSTGNISAYEWNFGDGSTINAEQNPSHTYQKAGTYSMSLTVTGDNGIKDTKVEANYITVTSPQLCPFKTSLTNPEFIDILHKLRDKRFTNFYGELLTSIFYRNAAEVNSILSAHPELHMKLRELVEKNIEIAQDLIDNGTANLPQRNADEITAFLSEIAKDGSLKLKFYIALTIKGIEYRYLTNGIGVRIE